ncbi:MAG: hypothetical protein AAB320_05765 [Elusimicrobiota bacterium]
MSLAKPGAAAAALTGASVALTVVGLWWSLSLNPRRVDALACVRASRDLLTLSSLQQRHLAAAGAYAADLDSLALLSSDPDWLKEEMGRHLDLQTLLVSGDGDGYILEANCLDRRRTLLHLEGPPGRAQIQ